MALSIPLTGLASNDVVPGQYVEIAFAQGAASSGTNTYSVLLLGNRTSSGDATLDSVVYGPDTPVSVQNEQDVINRFGVGSELHRMWRRFTAVNKDTPLYMLAVTAAGTQATGAIVASSTATGAGALRVFVGDDFCDASIASGDSVTTIGTAVAAAINAKLEWPVTASASAGTVTITAKVAGARGNSIRYSAQIISSTSITTTVTPAAHTAMTAGATVDTWTTALSTILPNRYYYIVPAAEDATTLGLILSQVNTQAQPTSDIRQRIICGSVDSLSNATTVATGLNAARCEVVWMQNSDLTPAELAASAAALYSLDEAPSNFRCNWNGIGNGANDGAKWKIRPPKSGTSPTRNTIKSALNNGLTPIGVFGTRAAYLVKRITSRSLNGSTADYRIRDAHKVTVCDRFADDLQAKAALQLAGMKIGDDPPKGGKPVAGVATPRVFAALIMKLLAEYAEDAKVQNLPTMLNDLIVQRESSPTTRLSARIPLQTIDILDQTTTLVDQEN